MTLLTAAGVFSLTGLNAPAFYRAICSLSGGNCGYIEVLASFEDRVELDFLS